ncbi:START-like domain containing protein [Acrasis kona]|uniref:START-like domain containing protein n=1 Tax=Acrasis kona TaxID=1008807 RepID=A0AAW2ZGE2_9EUKA
MSSEDNKDKYLKSVQQTREKYHDIIISQQDWTFAKEKDNIRIYTRRFNDGGPDMVKGVCMFENISPLEFSKHIASKDLSKRQSWDSIVSKNDYVETYSDTFEVIVNEYKLPAISRRDFVHAKELFHNEDSTVLDAVSTSVDEIANVPLNDGVVRGRFLVSWWHIEKVGENSRLTFSHRTELSGWIPNWIVSLSITDSPLMLSKLADVIGTRLVPFSEQDE